MPNGRSGRDQRDCRSEPSLPPGNDFLVVQQRQAGGCGARQARASLLRYRGGRVQPVHYRCNGGATRLRRVHRIAWHAGRKSQLDGELCGKGPIILDNPRETGGASGLPLCPDALRMPSIRSSKHSASVLPAKPPIIIQVRLPGIRGPQILQLLAVRSKWLSVIVKVGMCGYTLESI
jgi:hypothetical protein